MQRIFAWAHSHLASLEREEGQTMAEYAVILGLITAAVVGTIGLLSGKIDDVFNFVKDNINVPG